MCKIALFREFVGPGGTRHALRAVRHELRSWRDRPAGGELALRLVPGDDWTAITGPKRSRNPL